MSFEDVMVTVMRWQTALEALAALGAELDLRQSGESAPPDIAAALHAVTEAAGLGDLDELTPQQQMMVASMIRLYVRHAVDLLAEPARAAGWAYTDPVILEGWGRGSMSVPPVIAASKPEFADFTSILDVGTGVGLLAVAAAGVWPNARVVGVDVWEPSLERARVNVAQAGLEERVTIRSQDVADIDDVDAFDCVWVPTFFLNETAIDAALPALFRATRPGGWIVFGRYLPPPDPLAEAAGALRTIRGGGADLDQKRAIELLEQTGCTSVHVPPRVSPAPMELVVGQKPE